jgi:hypothetical protein
MLAFICLAYQMMFLLLETVPNSTDTWTECVGGHYQGSRSRDVCPPGISQSIIDSSRKLEPSSGASESLCLAACIVLPVSQMEQLRSSRVTFAACHFGLLMIDSMWSSFGFRTQKDIAMMTSPCIGEASNTRLQQQYQCFEHVFLQRNSIFSRAR